MKLFTKLVVLSFFLVWLSLSVLAQENSESEIRRLEKLERESVLKGDSLVEHNCPASNYYKS